MPDEFHSWHVRLDEMEGAGFSGAVLLERDGEIGLLRVCGLADRRANVPVNTSTIFDIGSVTKTFTAAAILKLVAAGALSTGQRLGDLLPEAPPDKAEITIHQLLTHSSGLADFLLAGGEPWEEYTPELDYEQVSRDDLLERVWRSRLMGPPGAAWSYSNAGYSLLAAIIEHASGRSYESFLREELLQPLGMLHTGYHLPQWSETDLAQGYIGERLWGRTTDKPRAADGHYWMVRGNGGMLSNLEDLRRWQGALHGELFPESLVERMLAPHVSISPENFIWQGYGWAIQQSSGQHNGAEPTIYHNGTNEVFSATWRWFSQSRRLLVILSNQADFPAYTIPRRLAEI
jgi:CubicO group peptidase (beta-lactamase class C family)